MSKILAVFAPLLLFGVARVTAEEEKKQYTGPIIGIDLGTT
jgi:hypothetical protein